MQDYQNVEHTFGPIYDKNSKILILGSFPSVKSREMLCGVLRDYVRHGECS